MKEGFCSCHSGIKKDAINQEKRVSALEGDVIDLWKELRNKINSKLFFFLVLLLVGSLGTVFTYQVMISSDIAVIKNEIKHINQAIR